MTDIAEKKKKHETHLVESPCECDHVWSQAVFLFPVPSTAGQLLPIRGGHDGTDVREA